MRVFDIPLSDKTGEHEPYMTAYLQEPMPQDPEKKLPAVVVYPGGGYTHLAAHEGEPVAMAYSGYGFQTFVLYYSLAPYAHYPAQLLDGARALSVIREHAEVKASKANHCCHICVAEVKNVRACAGCYRSDIFVHIRICRQRSIVHFILGVCCFKVCNDVVPIGI